MTVVPDLARRGADYTACLPRLRAQALALTRNRTEADDLVQEAVLRGWQAHDTRFTPGTNLAAWLATILRNAFLDLRARQRREAPLPATTGDPDDDDPRPDPASAQAEGAMQDLMAALDRLSDDHREVLILAVALGYEMAEVAAMTGLPVGTVKSRLARARSRLVALLARP